MKKKTACILVCLLLIVPIFSTISTISEPAEGSTSIYDNGNYSGCGDILTFPKGSYAQAPSHNIPLSILENPGIIGIHMKASWKSIETSGGVYDWSELDDGINKVTTYGKKVSLNLYAGGINTPEWVLSNPDVQLFTFLDTNKYHSSYYKDISIPVFWDPVFLEKKINFIQAAGERYANDPNVVATMVSFANAMSNEWHIPHHVGEICGKEIDQVQDWLDAGYTHEKMLQTGKTTIDAWAQSFPNQYLKLPIAPTDERLDGTMTQLAEDIVDYAYQEYPNRFFIQANGLCTKAPYADDPSVTGATSGSLMYLLKLIADHSPNVGLQMLTAASNGWKDHCRQNGGEWPCLPEEVLFESVNIGLSYNLQFLEYWEEDAKNEKLQPILKYATDAITNGIAIYIEKPRGICIADRQILSVRDTLVIGKITIDVGVYDENGVDRVEFYVDNVLKSTDDEEPYQWLWDEFAVGNHEIKVTAYDIKENKAAEKIDVMIFNFG